VAHSPTPSQVKLVVFEEDGPPWVSVVQPAIQFVWHPQFLTQPTRHGCAERVQPPRGNRQVCFQQTVELQQRFLMKRHEIQVRRPDAASGEAVLDGVLWETGILFPSGEPFFLGGRADAAILHERRSTIVIECRNTQDIHRREGI